MTLPESVTVHDVQCTLVFQTLFDIARLVDDDTWEQALEFCLRKGHVARHEVAEAATLSPRVRRVIAARGGLDLPHTDSLLETLAIQLFRRHGLPTPVRQHRVVNEQGRNRFVDLCWPELGVFLELDGQGHDDQPVYDAQRQNEVTRLTGWRCIRLTWDQVTRFADATRPRSVTCSSQSFGNLTMWMMNFSLG